MNVSGKKIVSYQEAFEVSRNLRWRVEFLEECGAMGLDFARGIEEELSRAKALLARPFNKKAKASELDTTLSARVARVEQFIQATAQTVH